MYTRVVYLRFSWLLSKYTSAWSVTSSGIAILYWLRPQEHDPCKDSWAIVVQLYKVPLDWARSMPRSGPGDEIGRQFVFWLGQLTDSDKVRLSSAELLE